MPDETAPEPSMDEILASIRRIISHDGAAHPFGGEGQEDALLLTDRVDPTPHKAEPVMTPTEPNTPAPEAEWVGETASEQAGSAFDKLADAAHSPAPPSEPIAMPEAGRSLEDVTRDLLRPMLKTWLDENLPRIVQARVDDEIDRIARRRAR